MIHITTQGSARPWGGVCKGLAERFGEEASTFSLKSNVAKGPSRGEGRALPGQAGRGRL